jgi:aspartyl-tRNA(Asn)/glutamyl-tRNA(Gln) amidotransferase subunit A
MDWPALDQLANELRSGQRDLKQLVDSCLVAIKKTQDYNAVLSLNPDIAHRVEQLTAQVKAGKAKGRLFGVPYLAKDNFLTTAGTTSAASHYLADFHAPYQATAIDKLEAEGAILLGKTNHDSFAHGSTTENSAYGPTLNPVDKHLVPGGTSGGSAAAVALGLCGFALGTDTGGSIRLPASYCGVVGLRPTYGAISRYGVIAMISSTDVVGPLTRNTADAGLLLDIMAGVDGFDATQVEIAKAAKTNGKLKIGIIKEHMGAGVDAGVRSVVNDALSSMEQMGHEISEISLPVLDEALACYYIVMPAETSSNLERYDGVKYGYSEPTATNLEEVYVKSRSYGFMPENQRRILLGTYVLSSGYYDAYYKQAQLVRSAILEAYTEAFKEVDVLAGPVAPTPAFPLGSKPDPLSMYLVDVMTIGAALAGLPSLSVPAGTTANLPVGLQLTAAQGQDRLLLEAASLIETSGVAL